jgi:hypothetical protein
MAAPPHKRRHFHLSGVGDDVRSLKQLRFFSFCPESRSNVSLSHHQSSTYVKITLDILYKCK